jgi:HrpA-like RNA helicase
MFEEEEFVHEAQKNLGGVVEEEPETKAGHHAKLVTLPIDEHRDRVVAAVRDNPLTIIEGSTGCGKSSRVPVFLLNANRTNNDKRLILVTQPRRIAATSLARRVASGTLLL